MNAGFAYHTYEAASFALAPARAAASLVKAASAAAGALGPNPLAVVAGASAEFFERITRRYPKQEWGIDSVACGGRSVSVSPYTELSFPFCDLVHFEKGMPRSQRGGKLLVVAPMSGHHATLLKDTVGRMLSSCDVYLTDWKDARDVALREGTFGLDDYVDYVMAMLRHLGPGTSVMAVCQPAVPVLSAVALMAEDADPCAPPAMVLMGGPVDVSRSPTAVNRLAEEKGYGWFEKNLISVVPLPYRGAGRRVYPGFMQLAAFMSMNPGRHAGAHLDLFADIVTGKDAEVARHREFYDEYMAVMDMDAKFYLDTILKVFVERHLPEGRMSYNGRLVHPHAIEKTALMTVEGGRDDITGLGQTFAAHDLCRSIPESRRRHHVEEEAGHYGIFSGSRWRNSIAPAVESFLTKAVRP